MGTTAMKFALKWMDFASSNKDVARTLKEQAMLLCEAMTADTPGDQIDKMIASEIFRPFQKNIIEHRHVLGFESYSDREIALWVRTICFCSTMRAEMSA